ncbi:hypothetical protein Syun_024571 [Stephania yunnanensis]|uniref:BAR domain-containing protein n=1 Tax=Stephania yunnanensis TaxID=152371 RepID=A0AAP0I4M2_9MAGN
MKSSLKKLRGFALHKNDAKEKRDLLPTAQLDELAQASEDMQDMRNCYDSLLSAAAATANSAYEFSESLREMGACLLEKTALNEDEESGRVLLMLGKVQYELQKLVDSYRSHIVQTITTPSESLLNELRTVEEMKRQCDEKRIVYEHIMAAQKEKGRPRGTKGESSVSQQLLTAHDEYDQEATLFIFRLKSLKQGQSRSLLTQAARHHAAQLNFFRKGLKYLETVEPHVKVVAENQHIDYQFSGLEDDYGEDGDGDDDGSDANDDGELSFDYGQNDHVQDVPTSRTSMELDQVELSFPQVSEASQESSDKSHLELYAFNRESKAGSQSAPIIAEKSSSQSAPILVDKKFDPAERIGQVKPSSTRKFHTYVLPTPTDAKSSTLSGSLNPVTSARQTNRSGYSMWHSSPLEPQGHEKAFRDDKLSGFTNLKAQSVLKESNSNSASMKLPPPLSEGFVRPQQDPFAADTKKFKRQAFSGPIATKPWPTKPVLSASGPLTSMDHPHIISGMLSRVAAPRSTSPKVSPSASPPLVSSPKISELHELPRPPAVSASLKSSILAGHSAPLGPRSRDVSPPNPSRMPTSNAASPLPKPPFTVSRSFSIPSSSDRAISFRMTKHVESSQSIDKADEVASPPLTPISFTSIKPTSPSSEVVDQASQRRGN